MQKKIQVVIWGFLAFCIALLVSCSGSWKTTKTSTTSVETSSNKKSNSNINIDTGPVKVKSNEKSASIFGVKIQDKSEKEYKEPSPEDKKKYLNGDKCGYCDYISRTENEQKNFVESAIYNNFKNGEEREYHNGELIRSSYYVDGGKKGKEYLYSKGVVIDSTYIESISGDDWNLDAVLAALPEPVAPYIYSNYITHPLNNHVFTTCDGHIQTIYNRDSVTSYYKPNITISYRKNNDLLNYKVIIRKPFYEELTIENGELAQRKMLKGTQAIYDYKKGEYLTEYYQNGAVKFSFTGNVKTVIGRDSYQCIGMCNLHTFFENGAKEAETFYLDSKVKQSLVWNKSNKIVLDLEIPNYQKEFYDNGTLKSEKRGKIEIDSLNNVLCRNGFVKEFFQNGNKKTEEYYENGEMTKYTNWYENGNLKGEGVVDSIAKAWHPNGELSYEHLKKNDGNESYKSWDSTGFLLEDYKQNDYFKKFSKDSSTTIEVWNGNILRKNEKPSCVGDCSIKMYRGKILTTQITIEGYDSTLNQFKKRITIDYDSVGRKIVEETSEFDKIISHKEWYPNGTLHKEAKHDKYYKSYYANKKVEIDFKGTSAIHDSTISYIEGIYNHYYENGKKKTERIWKDGRLVKEKNWSESGKLLDDFDENSHIIQYFKDSDKVKLYFKGSSLHNGAGAYQPKFGELQIFDEEGNLVKTKTYGQ